MSRAGGVGSRSASPSALRLWLRGRGVTDAVIG